MAAGQHREGREPIGVRRPRAVGRQRVDAAGEPPERRECQPQRRLLHPQHLVAVDQRPLRETPAPPPPAPRTRPARDRSAPPPRARPPPPRGAGCGPVGRCRSTGSAAPAAPAPGRAAATAGRSPASRPRPAGAPGRRGRRCPRSAASAARTAAPQGPTPGDRRADGRCAARPAAAPGARGSSSTCRPYGSGPGSCSGSSQVPPPARWTTARPELVAPRLLALAQHVHRRRRVRRRRRAEHVEHVAERVDRHLDLAARDVVVVRRHAALARRIAHLPIKVSPPPWSIQWTRFAMSTATTATGPRLDAEGFQIAVAAPDATAVELCVPTADGRERRQPMERDGDLFTGRVEGAREGTAVRPPRPRPRLRSRQCC